MTPKPVMNLPAYCQFLLSSHTNFTQTYFADHVENLSHDRVNRFLAEAVMTPHTLWEQIKDDVGQTDQGWIVFDDTVLDKRHSRDIEGVRTQYSGNEHGIIRGIGVVTCVYMNPVTNQFWAIDWRVFDPERDGKTKLDHMRDMLTNIHHHKKLQYQGVLMDTWYATRELMLFIESLNKVYYCPLKSNRLVDDSGDTRPYQPVEKLSWTPTEDAHGKIVKIKGFPRDHKVKLFRVPVSSHRTDNVVTNDTACVAAADARETCARRWTIEQLHREAKQLTGIERCQCRRNRCQRNHIACAFLVWAKLKSIARQTAQTVYQLKQTLLKSYLIRELSAPSLSFAPA
jgi:Transposase DDE domain